MNEFKKVIIADDDELFYRLLKPRLLKKGVFLIWARNGKEALEKIKKENPIVLITDIVMPILNGFELIKEVKFSDTHSNVNIIVLSNWGESQYVYDYNFLESLGISKYLVKSNHSTTSIIQEITKLIPK